MKQLAYKSVDGMFTQFKMTNVVRVAELINNQLFTAFRTLAVGAPQEKTPIALVDRFISRSGGRFTQKDVIKAIMISPTYYAQQVTANPSVAPSIQVIETTASFLMPGDRFGKALEKTNPSQNLQSTNSVIPVGGVVSVGYYFETSTLVINPSSVTPTVVNGPAGTITFPMAYYGEEVILTYVTAPIYPVLRIVNTADISPSIDFGMPQNSYAYVMHPNLATSLGISIPAV